MLKQLHIFSPVFFAIVIFIGLSDLLGLNLTNEMSNFDDIGFILTGACGLLHLRDNKYGSNLLASLVAFVGLYSFYLWQAAYFSDKTKISLDSSIIFGAGSLTPSFSIVMIAYSLAVFFGRYSNQKFFWFGVFGSLIASIGFVSLIDTIFEVETVYSLIEVNRVQLSMAIFFFGIGVTLILDALVQGAELRSIWVHWAMGILGVFLTLYTCQAIRSHDLIQLSNLEIAQTYRSDLLIVFFGFVATVSLSVFFRLSVQENSLQKKIFYDYVPVVIVGISMLLATSVYFFLHSNFRTGIHKKFQSDFKSQTIRLTEGLQKYSDVLYTIKDVFDVSNLVERDEFQLVSQRNIDRLPGLSGLGWIEKLSKFDQKIFEKSISKEINRPFYLFHRQDSKTKKKLKLNEIAYPVLYMEPNLENQDFLGLEMLGYKFFRDAIQDKSTNGILTISSNFEFVKSDELKQGIFSLLKVDKSTSNQNSEVDSRIKQTGYVFSLLDIEQAVQSILFTFESDVGINLKFERIDLSSALINEQFIYESTNRLSHLWGGFRVVVDDSLKRSIEMDFADTKWLVSGSPTDSVNYPIWEPSNLFLPISIFILGCFVALISKKRNKDIQSLESLQRDLEISIIEAQQSSQSKSDFLANMSHEIRTPMNGIIGMSHLVLQTKLSPKQRNYITKVHESGQSLVEIINDILDFSKIEAGKLDIESTSFSLEKVIQNFINLVGLRSVENNLNLVVDIEQDVPIHLIGDPLRLGQILINLGANAVKFTPVGEILLKVSVKDHQRDKITLMFSISDTGIGMSKEQVSRLFSSFTQADTSTTRKFGGTGLGLVISKRLCNLMNGEIWVDSVEDQGSTFSFTADFELDEEVHIEEITVPQALIDGRVLVVTDKITLSKVLYTNLCHHGLNVVTVDSINEAKSLLKSTPKSSSFSHLLIDWQISHGCAIEFVQGLGSDIEIPSLKFMFIATVYSKSQLFELASKLHYEINATITAPITPNSLFLDITKCLSNQEVTINPLDKSKDLDDHTLAQLSGRKVLLAEDNKVNQFLAVALLKQANLLVTVVENGKLAVDKILEEDFDAVLMDIQMPEMDGYTATKLVRQRDEYKDLPIIAMTANVMESDIEKIKAVGMNDYIAKPLDIKGMYLTIAKYVGKP
ncbi:MAG: response regulator [Candidatus Cloacimonetes bacterium]|nr:response regulator [Candidatus Cloacimonadota bacterium]